MISNFEFRISNFSARGSDRGYWDVVPAFGRDRTTVILSEAEERNSKLKTQNSKLTTGADSV